MQLAYTSVHPSKPHEWRCLKDEIESAYYERETSNRKEGVQDLIIYTSAVVYLKGVVLCTDTDTCNIWVGLKLAMMKAANDTVGGFGGGIYYSAV